MLLNEELVDVPVATMVLVKAVGDPDTKDWPADKVEVTVVTPSALYSACTASATVMLALGSENLVAQTLI